MTRTKLLELFTPAKIDLSHWKQDAVAGAITGIVAIPLGLALAIASGVPPIYGLYTSIIAGVILAFFGGVELGVSGPAAAMSLLLLGVVSEFGFDGLLLAGFLAGLIQILLGLTGIGRVVKFIPYSVITGFTTGIGFLILFTQLNNLTGITATADNPVGKLSVVLTHLSQANLAAIILALSTLALIFFVPRLSKKIPAAFIALAITTIAAVALSLPVQAIGEVPSGLPVFSIDFLDLSKIRELLPPAFAIALLASIESLLSAVAADGMIGTKHSSNKELVGQGIANTVLPFFKGIPCTGVIVRTATNINNGAKTRLSALIHSLVLILVVVFFAQFVELIPLAVLAGILVVTAIHLIAFDEIKYLLADSKSEVIVFLATVGSTLFFDLTTAILIGFSLAGLVFIKKISENVSVTLVPDSAPASSSTTLAPDEEGIARTYRVSGPLFFASALELEKIGAETPETNTPALVLDLLDVDYLDSSATAILETLVEKRRKSGEVYIAVTNPKIKTKILKTKTVGEENIVSSVHEGLQKAQKKYGKKSLV